MSALSSRSRRALLAVCGSLAVFFAARWAFLQGKPERLRDLPNQGDLLLDIRRGVAYFQMRSPQPYRIVTLKNEAGLTYTTTITPPEPLVIHALPVTGGPGHLLGEDRRPNLLFRQLQCTDTGVHYLAYPEKPTRYLTYPEMGRVIVRGNPVEQEMIARLPLSQATLFTIPLSGGAPIAFRPAAPLHITTPLYDDQPVCVVGDRVYWIEIDPAKRPQQRSGSLRVASQNGGPPETLMTGLPPRTSLRVPEETQPVIWMFVPMEENSQNKNVYRLTASDRKPNLFLRKLVLNALTFSPVTVNARIYWKREAVSLSASSYQMRRTEIVSAALDGSGERILHTFEEPDIVSALYAHVGKLYVDVRRQANRLLMRLDPGPPVTLRDVLRFPARTQQPYFDGDYLYYALTEERENYLDWSRRGRRPTRATVLCRFRLPR